MSQVTIIGSCGKDPELRFTASGRAMVSFSVAENNKFKKDGEWQESPTTWWNCVAWQELGENVAESITKGTRVIVTGRTQTETWETPEGDKRSSLKVMVDEVGPSLRWATARVDRNERRTPNEDPGAYVPPTQAPADNYLEEPF